MKTRKSKILILSGLKQDFEATVKSASNLAKMIDAEVDFFHVKKPSEIIKKENQLSAIRTINREQVKLEKELNSLLDPLKAKYAIDIKTKFTFGNVKAEIEKHINKTKPDVLVLGKRKTKLLNLPDDRVIEFVLNKFSIPVLIASNQNSIESLDNLTIGVLNSSENLDSQAVLNKLVRQSKNPLKSFRVIDKGESLTNKKNDNTVEYIFDKNDNTVNSISNYLVKSNVNLLYLNKAKDLSTKIVSLREIINKVNVPMLIAN